MTDTVAELTIDQFLDAIERGAKWGWKDRREIDGTIRVLTGPHAGTVLTPGWSA